MDVVVWATHRMQWDLASSPLEVLEQQNTVRITFAFDYHTQTF